MKLQKALTNAVGAFRSPHALLALVAGAFLVGCIASSAKNSKNAYAEMYRAGAGLQGDNGILTRAMFQLGAHAQPDGPVAVMVVPLAEEGLLGATQKMGGGYLIRIASEITDPQLQVSVLVHEWAHARAWHLQGPLDDDHGRAWGEEYSETYRALWGRDAQWTLAVQAPATAQPTPPSPSSGDCCIR